MVDIIKVSHMIGYKHHQALVPLIPQLDPRRKAPSPAVMKHMVHDGGMYFFAEHEGTTVGTAVLAHFQLPAVHQGWVDDVVVDEPMRGKGIGRALMEVVIESAHILRIDRLYLTSAAKRVPAHGLYRSLGFEEQNTCLLGLNLEEAK